MGQAITVMKQPGTRPDVMRFELNRSLTGMAIEKYAASPATPNRPPDILARRLFELGATHVTVYSNVVTVAAPPEKWRDIADSVEAVIVNLFIHYDAETGAPASPAERPALEEPAQ